MALLPLLLPGAPEMVPVGQQQAQGEEEEGGEQQLLVGVAQQVPALLVHVDEGGDAQESPHRAPGRLPPAAVTAGWCSPN